MGRSYAGILAFTGMTVALLQALREGQTFDGAVTTAAAWTAVFAGAGWVIGTIAGQTVEQAVLTRLESELQSAAPGMPASESEAAAT